MRLHQVIAMVASGIVACTPEHSARPTSQNRTPQTDERAAIVHTNRQAPAIAFGDSVPYHNDLTDGVLYHVTVNSAGRTDTIPGILVEDLPVLGADGRAYGIHWEENAAAGLFVYDPATHRTTRLPKPDAWWEYSTPVVAPDGSHVAYLARTGEGTGEARVAALPSTRVIYRGPVADLLPSDAGIDQIAWPDVNHFDIRIQLEKPFGATQRTRGAIAKPTEGVRASVDTLSASSD